MVTQTSGATAKEKTILSLSEDILKAVADLQERLDNRFKRVPCGDECETKAPVIPNVLDEIIENLQRGKEWLHGIMVFISSEVLPKIN